MHLLSYVYIGSVKHSLLKFAYDIRSGYLSVTGAYFYRIFVRYGTKLGLTRDERSEDRFRVRVWLDISFMAIYMNITVYTSEDHRNNRSDVFKCVKLKVLSSSTGGQLVEPMEYQPSEPGSSPCINTFSLLSRK